MLVTVDDGIGDPPPRPVRQCSDCLPVLHVTFHDVPNRQYDQATLLEESKKGSLDH